MFSILEGLEGSTKQLMATLRVAYASPESYNEIMHLYIRLGLTLVTCHTLSHKNSQDHSLPLDEQDAP